VHEVLPKITNRVLGVFCCWFVGKTFLNSIEYLDEKTNEWTTFVPKLPRLSGTESPQPESPEPESPQPESPQPESPQPESPQPDLPQANGIILQSLESQTAQGDGIVSCCSVSVFHADTRLVEGTVTAHRKGSRSNNDGSGSIMRFETSSECEALEAFYP
jgi:hypothetical protein